VSQQAPGLSPTEEISYGIMLPLVLSCSILAAGGVSESANTVRRRLLDNSLVSRIGSKEATSLCEKDQGQAEILQEV